MIDGRADDCKAELQKIARLNGITESVTFEAKEKENDEVHIPSESSCQSKTSQTSVLNTLSLCRVPVIPSQIVILESKVTIIDDQSINENDTMLSSVDEDNIRLV